MSTTEQPQVMLRPEDILAANNSRYALKKWRINKLAANIQDEGRVLQNVRVVPLEKPVDGKKYELIAGFYRHAAVTHLNEAGGDFLLPAVIDSTDSSVARLRTQLSENMERENQSPMDQAIAIRQLLDQGVSKQDVRAIFSVPGGRKGNTLQPASNSFVNMRLTFLELPKAIQNKIHNGEISVGGAYDLVKVKEACEKAGENPTEKLNAIVARLDAAREKEIEAEAAMEEKFLADQKKAEQAEQKAKEQAQALEVAKAELAKAEAAAKEATELAEAKAKEATKLYTASKKAKGDDAKEAKEAWKSAEAAEKAAISLAQDASKNLDVARKNYEKLTGKAQASQAAVEERRKKLEQARAKKAAETAHATPAPTSRAAVQRAAKAEGVPAGNGVVPLKPAEMKEVVHNLTLPSGCPKLMAIGKALEDCWAGIITEGQLVTAIAKATGEHKPRATTQTA